MVCLDRPNSWEIGTGAALFEIVILNFGKTCPAGGAYGLRSKELDESSVKSQDKQ